MFLEINGDGVAYTLHPLEGVKEITIDREFIAEMIVALDHATCDEIEEWMLQRLERVLPPEAIKYIQADKGFKIFCGSAGDFHVTDLATQFENTMVKAYDRISTYAIETIEMAMSELDCDYWEIPVTWVEQCTCCNW